MEKEQIILEKGCSMNLGEEKVNSVITLTKTENIQMEMENKKETVRHEDCNQ